MMITEDIKTGHLKQNLYGESYLYDINRGSFEKTSAYSLYESILSDSLFEENSLKIIIGSDSGLLAKYLISKKPAHGSRYIFIEPEVILKQLQNHQLIPKDLPSEIVFTTFEDWEECARTFKIADYFYISAIRSINSFCAQEAVIPEYTELSWLVTEKLNQMHWENILALGSETFIKKQLINLADNLLPASLLKNAFTGQTAVLMAGGPSLDECLPWIKQNRHKIILLAVSRIARQLLQNHIEPDFIFSVDPTEESFDISKEMLRFSNQPVFIYANHTISGLINQWSGTALYLGNRLPWKSGLNQDNFYGAGPTVTNTAIEVARIFGFNRILLAGVDLCFTREGYTHAKGSDEHDAGPRFNLTSLHSETNDGLMAPTSHDFKIACNTLSVQVKNIKNSCQIISLSKNSAKIKYIDYIPPEQIELIAPEISIAQIVTQKIHLHQKNANQDWPLLLKELESASFQIKNIYRHAKRALSVNQAMYNPQGIIENYKDKKKLDKLEKKLQRDYRKFSKLLKSFSVRKFIKITRPFEDEELTAEDAKELGEIYYQAYLESASTLQVILEDSKNRIRCRIEENSSDPDFDLIFKQWEKDSCPGRAHIWLQQHSHVVSAEVNKKFKVLEQKFDQLLENKETRHWAETKINSNFETLKQRAVILFKHSKLEELRDLKNSINKHSEQQAIEPYRTLVEGYIAELQNQTDTALAAYQQIIDSDVKKLHEAALLRISSLSIAANNLENSYLAFQCLSQLSPLYLPFYAEICRMKGLIKEAIETYSDYIEQFPTDSIVQLKLAHLLIDNQLKESAELILDFLIKNDKAAKDTALKLKRQLIVT